MANLLYRYGHDILFILASYLLHHSPLFPKFSFAWSFEISEALEANFQGLQDTLERRPSWATWDEAAARVPDKDAKARDIGGFRMHVQVSIVGFRMCCIEISQLVYTQVTGPCLKIHGPCSIHED